MFTGIVEEVGAVERVRRGTHSAALEIRATKILSGLIIGDSVAVNGVCLTVTSFDSRGFTADVMHETLDRSTLSQLGCGSLVNLERAMVCGGRFGGHMVSGHVDGRGKIAQIRRDDTAVWYVICAEPSVMRYLVEKGSVAVDGISLTVATVSTDRFSVSAIPHTVAATTLGQRSAGDLVNLENDIVGKYVEKLLGSACNGGSRLTRDFLERYGY